MMSLLDSFMFEVLRPMVYFGVPMRPVLKELDAQAGESVLDAGCGFGNLARNFRACRYTGIDLDKKRIGQARTRHGESENRSFISADICRTGLPSKSFDRTLAYGLLHHLSDEQALACILELSRLTKKKIVFLDTVYSKHYWTNNCLAVMDQGKFVRNGEAYTALVEKANCRVFYKYVYANNAIAKFFLMTCELGAV